MFAVISFYQLEQMLDQGRRLLLIDLRSEADYEESHLAGAISIPYYVLEEGMPEEAILETYGKIPLVFYCEHGGKSMRAARDFAGRGWQTASVGSGFQYYRGKYLVSG